jgi:hypothetical protein
MQSAQNQARTSVMARLSCARDFERMNLDEAMLAHAEWNLKLHLYLHGEGKLDANVVCRDNACKLGTWSYSDGPRYANEAAYASLRMEHANFHRCAACVVSAVDDEEKALARTLMDAGSDYERVGWRRTSQAVDGLICVSK